MGNTRSHSEHVGKDTGGRWYYAGDGMEEQVAAGFSPDNIPCKRVIIYSTLKTAYRRSKDIKKRKNQFHRKFSAKRSNAYEIEKGREYATLGGNRRVRTSTQRSSDKEHKVNALALSADERRDKLR